MTLMNTPFANLLSAPALAPPEALLALQSPLGSVATILIYVLTVFNFLIFIRAILSWFMPVGRDPLTRLLVDVTEPILAPARQLMGRMVPNTGMDYSPMFVLLLIQFILIPMLNTIR
jgi:YggT family protein